MEFCSVHVRWPQTWHLWLFAFWSLYLKWNEWLVYCIFNNIFGACGVYYGGPFRPLSLMTARKVIDILDVKVHCLWPIEIQYWDNSENLHFFEKSISNCNLGAAIYISFNSTSTTKMTGTLHHFTKLTGLNAVMPILLRNALLASSRLTTRVAAYLIDDNLHCSFLWQTARTHPSLKL